MKKEYIVELISYFLIFCMGIVLLINPNILPQNENYLFFIIMVIYGLISYVLYMIIRPKSDYEYLFTSLVSVIAGASGIVFREQNPTLVLSLSLMSWISMMAIVKLIKIDYYHDRNDYLWLIRSFTFIVFLIVGTLTCVNLYYNNNIQTLMLGFFLTFVALLESFDPIVKYMIRRRRRKITKLESAVIKENKVIKLTKEVKQNKKLENKKNLQNSSETRKNSKTVSKTKQISSPKSPKTKKTNK